MHPAVDVIPRPFASLTAILFVAALGAPLSCSGGGGGSSLSFDDQAELLSILFPDPEGVNPEPEDLAPQSAPLVQSIEFHFSGRPDPQRVSRNTLPVVDAIGNPARGSYRVDGAVVTFTPELPTREASALSDTVFDNGGAGLEALSRYSIRIGPQTFGFIAKVADELRLRFPDPSEESGVLVAFETTGAAADFFRGIEARRPRLTASDPVDGTLDFSPELYTDPDGLFAPRRSMQLHFDAPVHPAAVNLEKFLLVDLDDRPAGSPAGLSLGVDVRVVRNEVDASTVELSPSGILPFDHLLSLEHPAHLAALSEADPDPGAETTVAAILRVAAAPETVRDLLVEDFDTAARLDDDPAEIEVGELFAEWDKQDSDVLQASFAFEGGGELGRFVPSPPAEGTKTVILDTSRQTFPLLDGSTPDAPAGFEVVGGVFPFTDIDIPSKVSVDVRGPNPLVLTATGSVRIAGTIRARGRNGTPENAFDSAVTANPGGAGVGGGGRGGEGHPIFHFPPNDVSYLTLVSPPYGGRGFGPGNHERTGGHGGQCGILDLPDDDGNYTTDREIDCSDASTLHNNGYKPPGGGGGSMLAPGEAPKKHGVGNVLADGTGGWLVRTPATHVKFDRLERGPKGDAIFVDGDPDNDYIGVHGEFQDVFGGQGGGAGGSALDAYFCGEWCVYDQDESNDLVCKLEFGNPPTYAGSVGDARGGSAGAGGGAVIVKALGEVLFTKRARVLCDGGTGGSGAYTGCGNWSGGGGGGAGGAIVVQSAVGITVPSGATLDVNKGGPGLATKETNYAGGACPGARRDNNVGAGGYAGHGIIQLQVPLGKTATVESGANLTAGAWVDQNNTRNPAEFGGISVAIGEWYDMGRVIARPPADTNPLFGFRGLGASGLVMTDAEGYVIDPKAASVRCDYLGQLDPLNPGQYLPGEEPRADFVPLNATVELAFQGARAIAEGSKEIDPDTITEWSPSVEVANGHQFVRYRVRFDIGADGGTAGPRTPRPAVQSVNIDASF